MGHVSTGGLSSSDNWQFGLTQSPFKTHQSSQSIKKNPICCKYSLASTVGGDLFNQLLNLLIIPSDDCMFSSFTVYSHVAGRSVKLCQTAKILQRVMNKSLV